MRNNQFRNFRCICSDAIFFTMSDERNHEDFLDDFYENFKENPSIDHGTFDESDDEIPSSQPDFYLKYCRN